MEKKFKKLKRVEDIQLGRLKKTSVSLPYLMFKCMIEFETNHRPAYGYLVKLYAIDIDNGDLPVAFGITDKNGFCSINMRNSDLADELFQQIRKNGNPKLRIEVYEPSSMMIRKIILDKESEWGKIQTIKVPSPKIAGFAKQQLYVQGKVINLSKKLSWQRLKVEVWDRHSHQQDSLAESMLNEEGSFEFNIPAEKAFSSFNTHPILWLRIRDIEDNNILTFCNRPLAFDREGKATQSIHLPTQKSLSRSSFNPKKRIIELQLALSPDDVEKLYLAGVKTLKDATELKGAEIAKKTGINLDKLDLIVSFTREIRDNYSNYFTKMEDQHWIDATRKFGDTIQNDAYCLVEDTWEYRFTDWDRGLDLNGAAERYLSELGIVPKWRNQKIRDWITTRRWWWDKFNIDVNQLWTATDPPDKPFKNFTYAYQREEVLSALEGGPDNLRKQIQDRIKAIENDRPEHVKLTTWTGTGEDDGTRGEVWYDYYYIYTNWFIVEGICGIYGHPLNNPGADRRPGQMDEYNIDTVPDSALSFGEESPRITLKGTDGWLLVRWKINVLHNGIWYNNYLNWRGYAWFDSPGDYDWCYMIISNWENPFQYYKEQLEQLLDDIEILKNELDNVYRLQERIDEILKPILEGNKHFLKEDYPNAVLCYRQSQEELGNFEDEKETDGYKRLQYILSLHIGDCYWGHREYERAIIHFSCDTCPKRNLNHGHFDNHFLWNHIASCMLDWADHRYRVAGDNHQKRHDFDSIEEIADPIDPAHPYSQINREGAYKLYSRVLERCFNCFWYGSDLPPGWVPDIDGWFNGTAVWDAIGAINGILILFDWVDEAKLNKMNTLSMRINDQKEIAFQGPNREFTKRFNCSAVFTSLDLKSLKGKDFKEITLLADCSESIPFKGIRVLCLNGETGKPVKLFADHYIVSELVSDLELKLIEREWRKWCDLNPSISLCENVSDILLLRAQAGVSSIDACLNPLGLRDDYVPAYRFNFLKAWAEDALNRAKDTGDRYINYTRIVEQLLENQEQADHALQIAEKNLLLGELLVGIAQNNKVIADERPVAIQNQMDRLEDERNDALTSGIIGHVGRMFGMFFAGLGGREGGGVGAGYVMNGFIDILKNGINTSNWINDIDRRQEALEDQRDLAEKEAEQAWRELEAQQRRRYMAELEKNFLNKQKHIAEGDNFRNPEVWYKIAQIQKRLFFSAMNWAILACWYVQKAIEFEIEVGTEPPILNLPISGEPITWRPLRFDYLDQVLMSDGEDLVETSPLVIAITGEGRLEDDFNNLKNYHLLWYDVNIPEFPRTELFFSRVYPLQLAQIRNAYGRDVKVHFSTDIKLFDSLHAAYPVYGRFFYVQVFWDASTNDPNAFSGELANSYETETETPGQLIRSSLSYWRVPDSDHEELDTALFCNPELIKARYINDWIDYTNSIERWILKAKATIASLITIYNIAYETDQEWADIMREKHMNFLYTFENTGLQCDWTLYLHIPQTSQAMFSQISEIKLKLVWKASQNDTVTPLIRDQRNWGTTGHTYVWRFSEAPEHQLFEQIFDPNNQYTNQITTDGYIDFNIVEDGNLPGQVRQMKSVYLVFFFDENTIDRSDIPSLTARLIKAGVVDTEGQPIEFIFISPTETESPPFQFPDEFIDQDPAGIWSFQMVSTDNLDADGNPKSLRGLIDILLIIEYEYNNP